MFIFQRPKYHIGSVFFSHAGLCFWFSFLSAFYYTLLLFSFWLSMLKYTIWICFSLACCCCCCCRYRYRYHYHHHHYYWYNYTTTSITTNPTTTATTYYYVWPLFIDQLIFSRDYSGLGWTPICLPKKNHQKLLVWDFYRPDGLHLTPSLSKHWGVKLSKWAQYSAMKPNIKFDGAQLKRTIVANPHCE